MKTVTVCVLACLFFSFFVTSVKAECGDGIIELDETCDDNNTVPFDGCTNCTVDSGWQCSGQPSVCTAQAPIKQHATNQKALVAIVIIVPVVIVLVVLSVVVYLLLRNTRDRKKSRKVEMKRKIEAQQEEEARDELDESRETVVRIAVQPSTETM